MAGFLRYRFPNEAVVSLKGSFKKVAENETIEGFFISDFLGENKYVFHGVEVLNNSTTYFTESSIPYVCNETEYKKIAHSFLADLCDDQIGKAVFSTVLEHEFNIEIALLLFQDLCEKYQNAFIYLFTDEKLGTWVGASPEILLSVQNNVAKTIALAGTLPIDEQFVWTSKEKEEQQMVSDFILNGLKKFDIDNLEINGPKEVKAGPIRHLRTDFDFELNQKDILPLAFYLHPTPAVSGLARDKAIELIQKHEKHQRKFYAGMIGFVSNVQTKIYVNLRCAQLFDQKAYLFVGGGFTKESDIDKEWAEVNFKSRTLTSIMNEL